MAFIFRSRTTYDAMVQLLNEQDEKEQDRLTEQWKSNKIEELNFIGIVGALLAGVLTSTGSWPNMLEGSTQTPWSIRTCWFCGIDFALAAVITAASQAIRLHRLSCRSDGLRSIRLLLCMNHRRRDGRVLPQRRQVVLWQLAIFWLVMSAVLMIVGLLMLSWKAASAGGWWSGQAQLALIYSILTVLILLVFAWEQWVLFSWDAIDEAGKNGCALGDANSHEG